ncbi:phage tail family protein [Clostridium thailandense]|uniref:phage tail family protein n=1 Tax=Clostridium thailandense TaxID=2794346 RepID=UPI003988B42D
MSKKLIYVNSSGAKLEITNSAPFLLQQFDPTANVNIYNTKGLKQDGSTYLGNTLDVRDITLQIAVMAASKEELNILKQKINTAFNPKLGEGYLIYSDNIKERKVKCIVNKLPYFTVVSEDTLAICLINLTANNPFWVDTYESKEEIAVWLGDFEFELEFTEDGIEMGHREPSLIVNVTNNGDVECGIKIEFKALATVVNPSIININTREYMKINKIMTAGEVITVNTAFGEKRMESYLNGVTSNALKYIDLGSTFLQLDTGDNLLRYDADENIDNLEVSLYYITQYLGV